MAGGGGGEGDDGDAMDDAAADSASSKLKRSGLRKSSKASTLSRVRFIKLLASLFFLTGGLINIPRRFGGTSELKLCNFARKWLKNGPLRPPTVPHKPHLCIPSPLRLRPHPLRRDERQNCRPRGLMEHHQHKFRIFLPTLSGFPQATTAKSALKPL